MVQKTVRFYENVPEDMKALKSVNEYQKYGFRCARDMIITAINIYSQNSDPDVRKLLNGIVDIEELANRIVCKLEERQIVIPTCLRLRLPRRILIPWLRPTT